MGGASQAPSNSANQDGDILTFGEMESSPEANADVLLDDEEVPL